MGRRTRVFSCDGRTGHGVHGVEFWLIRSVAVPGHRPAGDRGTVLRSAGTVRLGGRILVVEAQKPYRLRDWSPARPQAVHGSLRIGMADGQPATDHMIVGDL